MMLSSNSDAGPGTCQPCQYGWWRQVRAVKKMH